MIKIRRDIVQGSDDWIQEKLGKLSASKNTAIMAKQGLGKGAETLAIELIAEEMTNAPLNNYTSPAMEHGLFYEADAFDIYESNTELTLERVGGIESDDGQLWYSPDGLVGDDGLIEIKCPQPVQHIKNLTTDDGKDAAMNQMQFGLMLSGRKWCDFITYNPDFPEENQMRVTRVHRDEEVISLMEQRIKQFMELKNSIKGLLK